MEDESRGISCQVFLSLALMCTYPPETGEKERERGGGRKKKRKEEEKEKEEEEEERRVKEKNLRTSHSPNKWHFG